MARTDTQRAASAARLIEKFGSAAKLVRSTVSGASSAYDPTGAVTAEEDDEVFAVVVDYTREERDGRNIETGHQRALVSAPANVTEPGLDTRLRFEKTGEPDINYRIVEVEVLRTAGPFDVPILFDLQVRK